MALTRSITYVARCDAPVPHREGGGGLPGSVRELEIRVPDANAYAALSYTRDVLRENGWRVVTRPKRAGHWVLCPTHRGYRITE